jgi:hypothetical protein
VFPSPPDNNPDMIAEIYFRLAVDQISHTRRVYALMEFIGGLGGVGKLLLRLSGWLIGGYASFHSALMTMSALYKV